MDSSRRRVVARATGVGAGVIGLVASATALVIAGRWARAGVRAARFGLRLVTLTAYRRCPACRRVVRREARVCAHCRSAIRR